LNAQLELASETPATDIVVVVSQNPGLVLLDSEKFDAFYDKMKAETDKLVPDTSSAKGRDEIRSVAARVVRAKASIDKARLTLTKEWRDNTKLANDAGKVIEERLSGLAEEVRAPLTAWEAAEKARIDHAEKIIGGLREMGKVAVEDTAAMVRERGSIVYNMAFDPAAFGDLLPEAESVKAASIDSLKAALARLTREEADRAELAKLRAEREEADRIAAEREAEAQRERDRIEAERVAAERKAAAEKADADRIRAAQEAAAQAARDEAAATARAEQEARDRAHQEEIAAERAKAAEAERLRQAEADRAAQIERERKATEAAAQAEAERVAKEQAKRQANIAHRTRVKTAAKQAIMTCGCDEETAQKIVLAIIAGEIPAVTLGF
jgi:hypothetical protein